MGTVPRSSIPSMASQMQGLRIDDKSEKALMVRVGVLIDALVEAERGLSNPGQGSRRKNVNNLKKPKGPTGTTQNVFNGISVSLNESTSSANLSHQEVQIDTDEGFGNPTQKQVFANNTTFKGLTENTGYNIRARLVTKDGQVSPWELLDRIITTSSTGTADLDGDNLGATVESKEFTFSTAAQEVFCTSALGFTSIEAEEFGTDAGETDPTQDNIPIPATFSQSKLKLRMDDGGGFADVEEITFPGVEGSNTVYIDFESMVTDMTVTRRNPIVFFTLVDPDVASFPDVRVFDVQIASGLGSYAASTKDTVWVEF